ncbi:hypothetical protein [Qaidamihabitans albus]|uniref:hypothetical protein n=1 Tax=Qaidamihabitans albus TaxID=2795733 RepID=UPI0018F181AC|nr:hypothetical protein [Qaidamihabitans albus]
MKFRGRRALYFGHLVSIFSFAIEDRLITTNINRAQVVVWPHERAREVREKLSERYKPAVDVPTGIGVRKGELFGCSLADVDRDRGIARIDRQVRLIHGRPVFAVPKGGKIREVPIGAQIM